MAGLLDELASQGLISRKERNLGEGLARISSALGTTTVRNIAGTDTEYNDSYREQLSQEQSYLQKQINKQKVLEEQTGPLSYNNLTSTNPLVSLPTNLLNFGTQVAGSVADLAASTMGGINAQNAEADYGTLPNNIRDIYHREKLDEQRSANEGELFSIRNAIAEGKVSSLVGYDKKYKTQTELDKQIKQLELDIGAAPVTDAERALVDSPSGEVMARNSLLTPLRSSYRDVINQVEQNRADDAMWRGNREQGIDNFFGSRSWGNDLGTQRFSEEYAARNAQEQDPSFVDYAKNAAGALAENPRMLMDAAAQTVPFLLGRTANVAFAGDAMRVNADSVHALNQDNNQEGLTLSQAAIGPLAAAAYTGLNLVERNTLLNATRGVTPGKEAISNISQGVRSASSKLSDKVSDALPASVVNAARTVNSVLPTQLATSLLRNAATTGAVEGTVEMGQQYIEDSLSKGKLEADESSLAQAAVLGAAMGSAFSVPGSVIEYSGNKLNTQITQQVEEQLGDAETTNEDMLNPANPDYAPAKVVNRILATEVKAGNYDAAKQQVDDIVNSINTNIEGLKQQVNYAADPQALADRITAGETKLAAYAENNTVDTDPNYDMTIQIIQGKLDSLKALHAQVTSPDYDITATEAAINKMGDALNSIEPVYKSFNDAYAQRNTNAATDTQEAATEQTEATDTTAEPETVEQEATRHLGAPTVSNLQRINELMNDNSLSEALRSNLRVVSEALLLANKKKDSAAVSKQVTKGDIGFRGTEQYLDEMAKAMKTDDSFRQQSLLNQMDSFKRSRNSKLAAIQEAQELADSTGKQVQVIKPKEGNWQVVTGKAIPNSQFDLNNGIRVNAHKDGKGGADSLIKYIEQDLAEINATEAALQAMRGINSVEQVNELPAEYDPVQEAMDELNANERATERDMDFRNLDPNVQTVPTELENNEGDLIDNSTTLPLTDASPIEQGFEESPTQSRIDVTAADFTETDESSSAIVDHAPTTTAVDDEVKAAVEPKAKPKQKKQQEEIKPERFNPKAKFNNMAEAQAYLDKHSKDKDYFRLNNGKDGVTLQKHVLLTNQPSVSSDMATTVANEHDTVNDVVADLTTTELNVSEAATETNQVDTNVIESIVGLEDNSTQTTTSESSPAGAISTLVTDGQSNKQAVTEERKKGFQLQNLLKSGFIQRLKEGFNSPLVTTYNYASSIKERSRKAIVDSVIEHTGKPPSEEQVILLNDFMNFNKAYGANKHIRTITKQQANTEYNFLHFSDFFLNDKGELDENTATAIAASIYSWVGENASKTINDKKAMAKILGIKNADSIPPAVANRIAVIGTHQKTLAAELGQRIYQSLQLKMLKDVDPSRQAKVEQMLGTVAVGTMISMGMAERTRITNADMYAMTLYTEQNVNSLDPSQLYDQNLKGVNKDLLKDRAYSYYIRPSVQMVNGQYLPTQFNQRIQDLHVNTKGIMSAIFGFTPYVQLPSLEVITELPHTFNQFEGKLPSMVKEALLKQQALAYKLDIPMVELAVKLSETKKGKAALDTILGKQDPLDRHIAFEKGIKSTNLGIDRSIRLLTDTYAKVADASFYLPSTVWSNFRNGNPAGFNPQGDKIHRAFTGLDKDLITVPLTDTKPFKEDGSLSEYGMFLRGLAFRMEDVKINGNAVDKTLVHEFLPQFDEYISSPEVTTAANSLNNLLTDNYVDTDLNNVTDLLVKWEMSALGLSALMAINARNQAINKGDKAFSIRMAADSDGLVNGPAITNVMMNTGNDDFLRSVGIFPFATADDIQLTSVQQLRKDPNARDPYEQLADLQNYFWSELDRGNTVVGNAVRALDYLDKDYGKRKGAKLSLTPFNYGAGFDAVNRASARGTLDAIYKKIETAGMLYQSDTRQVADKATADLAKAINTLINYSNVNSGTKAALVTADSIGNMANLLSPSQEQAIKNTDIALRGSATESALTTLLGNYIKERNGKTAIANTAFDLYKIIYDKMLSDAEKAKLASGTAHVVKGKAIEILTAEEKQQVLRNSLKYMPSLATPEGIKSNQEATSAIPMVSTGVTWNQDKEIEIIFNERFGHLFTNESSSGPISNAKTTTLKSNIREATFESPGVAGLALYIQSHDAFVTYSVMQALDAQNFHDANSTNAYDLVKMAQVQNEAFLDAVTISHIGKAFTDGLTKSLQGVIALQDQLDITQKAAIAKSLQSMMKANGVVGANPKIPLDLKTALLQLYATNYQNDLDKLTTLMGKHSIHQYATEGGGYSITEAKRKQISQRIGDLVLKRDKALKDIAVIADQLTETQTKPIIPSKNPETVIADKVTEVTKTDSLHEQILANKSELTDPKKLIKLVQSNLSKHLKATGINGRYAQTYNELLNISALAINDNLQVNIIDGTTDTSKVLGYDEAVAEGMSAWFSHKGNTHQINLRMTTGDAIDTKVVTHELIHAATAAGIATVKADPKSYPKAAESLAKLERLYEHVKLKAVGQNNPIIQYGVTNLDEFIATGLTYPKFMDFLDNITDIPIETRSKGRIATAFRAMVSNILDVLYTVSGNNRTYSTKTLSAYEALVMDTAEFISRNNTPKTGDQLQILGAPRKNAINQVSEYSALEVYDALNDGSLDPKFSKQLGLIINNVTDKLFSVLPNKFARGNAEYSPEELWDKALKSGKAPYVTSALAAGFKLTAQEQFAIEALEVALTESTKSGSVSTAYRTIARSFNEAKAKLSPSDFVYGSWEDATADAKQEAERKYNYIFKVNQADYITRFTAMALASQEFNQLLNIKLSTELFSNKGKPAFDKLIDLANRAVNYTTERLTNTIGSSTIQGKLPRLAELLINIDLKNRNKAVNKLESYLINTETTANELIIGIRSSANKVLLNSPLPLFNNKYANIITNTLKATQDGRSPISVFDALRDFRNTENPNERLGFLGELANEIGDQNASQLLGEKLLAYAKHNEGTAQRIRTVVKEDVLSRFHNKGADLTRDMRAAVSQGLLRTDAQSLLASYGYDGLVGLITDRAELHKEIRKLESKIKDPVKISRTKSLGYYMVSGIGDETLGKNPTVIAQNAGLGIELTYASNEDIKLIDDLASLYALKYTDGKTLATLSKVIDSEKTGENGGGIYSLVKYHESLAKESYEELFARNIVSYTKGYIPNITNPHKEIVVATNSADKDRLRTAMYTEIGTVNKAEIDPSNQVEGIMFYSEDAGSQRYISGAMALYNYGRKGTEIDMTTVELVDAINKARQRIDSSPDFDPRKRNDVRAIPTYDTEGKIMAFNYEMSGRIRDTYLERNNDFSELIGEYTAGGFNKVVQADQNIAVADALIDHFRSDYNKDPKGFIYVGAGVQDPVLSQSWAMIPKEIREHIYARTGNNGIYVHNQAYLTIFGNKKYSLTNTFDKYQEQQNIAEQLFTGLMKAFFNGNARLRVAQGERIWQEGVHLLKDFVIIRNMSTALINMISNSFLLMAHGVSPVDIVKHVVEAVKAGGEYRKNTAELIKLQNRQRIDVGNSDELQQRINMLQQRVDKNPLKSFIDEGMFAGIVEDIDVDNQSYTYASGLQRKYEGVIDGIPKTVRNVARYAFVSPGTPLYQFLHSATQYGDFSAKYALYKFYTEKAKVKLSHDAAITKASNNFINYDVPTSQGMQYANDMGIVMFTKYNLRIQRALFELFGKRPASVIGQAIVINALSNLPAGIDPLVFNQIGNPLRNGPLGLLGAWDEPFPIQIMKSMF